MLELKDICKTYAGRIVLHPIRLKLPAEKTHVLLGSSGSGKSTLLRIVLSLVPPDSGSVELNGRPVAKMTPAERAAEIGYVPQEGGLFPHFTAEENVSLVARSSGWPKAKIRDRVSELAGLVALDESLLARYPKELSGGQKQRVAIMRAAFKDPKFLILDEPLGALDPIIRSELQMELKGIFRSLGKTVVLVTHDIGEAAYLGDSVSLLREGRLIQTGTMADLLNRPAEPFVTQFINAQRTLQSMESDT
jgi:osmoprotectant transport system ATP-binding protein